MNDPSSLPARPTETAAPSMQWSNWLKKAPVVVLLAAASYLFLRGQTYHAPKQVDLAALSMQKLDGSTFDARALVGKAVVLNFWAPWCPPCRLELPWLERLQNVHPDLVVLGVEDDSNEYGHALSLATQSGITYPLVRSSTSIQNTFGQTAGLPTTLYISPSGKIVHTVSGVIPEMLMVRYAEDATRAG